MLNLKRVQFDPWSEGGVILRGENGLEVYRQGKKIAEAVGLDWLERLIANLTSGSYQRGALYCRGWLSRDGGGEAGEGVGIDGLSVAGTNGAPCSDNEKAEVIEALRRAARELRARVEEQAEMERLYRLAYP